MLGFSPTSDEAAAAVDPALVPVNAALRGCVDASLGEDASLGCPAALPGPLGAGPLPLCCLCLLLYRPALQLLAPLHL